MGFNAAQSLQVLTAVLSICGSVAANAIVYSNSKNMQLELLIEGVGKATLIVQTVMLVILVDFDNASFGSLWYTTFVNIAASLISFNLYLYCSVIFLLPFFFAL